MTRYHPRDKDNPEKVAAARARSEAVERGKPPPPPLRHHTDEGETAAPAPYHAPVYTAGVRRYGDHMYMQDGNGDWCFLHDATELDKQEWPDFAEHAAKLAGEINAKTQDTAVPTVVGGMALGHAALGLELVKAETGGSGDAGPPECTSELCWCTTPPRLGHNDRIGGRCGLCGWSLGIVAWLSGKCTRCAHKLAHSAVQQCCPTCGNTDPKLRGGPSIGYGCYDAWHDPAASPRDRQLAAALRRAEAVGCVCDPKYCYTSCRACQAISQHCIARPACAQSTGHAWQPEPLVKLAYGPTENQSELRASPPDAKPAVHGGMPQWPGMRVAQDPDTGQWVMQFDPPRDTAGEIDMEQQVGKGGGVPIEVVASGPEPPPNSDWPGHKHCPLCDGVDREGAPATSVGVVAATIIALVALGLALAAIGIALAVPVP